MRELDDTPARLVAAAERLFASGGEDSTSLRAIARAALANTAAVHYHFGGRDALLRAVLDRHLGPLHSRRLALLEVAAARHGGAPPLAEVLGAAFRPDLELLAKLRKHRVHVARFLGRAHTLATPAVTSYIDEQFDGFARGFLPSLGRCLPDIDEAQLRLRLRLASATVATVLATAPEPGERGPLGSDDIDEQLVRLVAFCGSGIAAPPSPAPPSPAPPSPAPLGTATAGAVSSPVHPVPSPRGKGKRKKR
jgi:AcrR family transcriptional regulator